MITEEKLGKMTTFWRNNLASWAQILSEDFGDCIPHNVKLCKQNFLQECLLLIRKSCNWFSVIAFMEKTTLEIKTCKMGKNINFYCK